ncbi:MAG: tryptophan--tRNA ligase [Patescibacteria group bacterium]
MNKDKKILVSGIQPSGTIHIGNYFGAMVRFLELQDECESYIFIANYHALTTVVDKEALVKNTEDAVLDYLAIGLNPETLFLQSDIPEVTELAWIFNTLVTVPYLSRAVAYKEKVEKGLEANVGLFDYPVLMAADILIMGADIVPVGADQKQHIEIARDIAEKFNARYGNFFALPKAHILKEAAIVPGIDGQKMSKSYGNFIPLFAEDPDIEKLVMRIVTDSKGEKEKKDPDTDTVFALHRLFSISELPELRKRYESGRIGYRESKEILAENIKAFIAPLREKRRRLAEDTRSILDIIKKGRERARERARANMADIRKKVGVSF